MSDAIHQQGNGAELVVSQGGFGERLPSKADFARIAELERQLAAYKQHNPAPPPPAVAAPPLKLDLGCGTRKQEGFVGVDGLSFPGVDVVTDLAALPWPWADASVDEVFCSHMLEHVPGAQRPHFFNELFRVLKPGARAQFVTPHWASERAFGDVTHQWPPVVPMFWLYLDKEWRKNNAPHCPFVCDFGSAAMIQPAPTRFLQGRNQEFLTYAVTHGVNTGFDMHCTLTKRGAP